MMISGEGEQNRTLSGSCELGAYYQQKVSTVTTAGEAFAVSVCEELTLTRDIPQHKLDFSRDLPIAWIGDT